MVSMSADANDAALRAHIHGFLAALGERPEELLATKLAAIRQPTPQDLGDLSRYITDLKNLFGQGLLDMYRRIDMHGRAICELTDETEITERVQRLMRLVALDCADVPKTLARFDDAASELNPLTLVRLVTTIQGASLRGVPRQAQRDDLLLDLATYCLTRFPPSDES
jgi:uncharacterized membrane protein YccC